jgi:hypothetical protein
VQSLHNQALGKPDTVQSTSDDLQKMQRSLKLPFKTVDEVNAVFADQLRVEELKLYVKKFVKSQSFTASFYAMVLHPDLAGRCFFRSHG